LGGGGTEGFKDCPAYFIVMLDLHKTSDTS
jgi:hypothetical protein